MQRDPDPINNFVLPLIGVGLLWTAWYYWGLPWDVIKEVLFHDL
jgi:hypothetical protein